MSKRGKSTHQSIQESWEKLGYTVESFYDEEGKGGRVFRPKQAPGNSQRPPKSQLGKRLMARLNALQVRPNNRIGKIMSQLKKRPLIATRKQELLQRYDTIIAFLMDTLKTKGPIRPPEYAEIYQTTGLGKIFHELMSTGGLRLCKECNKILHGRQRSYCGQVCRKTFLTRQYREKHPELKLRRQ